MSAIRLGVIGYGFMGRTHAYNVSLIPLHYADTGMRPVLHAVAASTYEKSLLAQREAGFAHACHSWRELLAMPEVDAVGIATPTGMHYEMLLAAIAAGKHIYVDKPMVCSAQQAADVRDRAQAAGIVGHVALNYRYFASVIRARELVAQGRIGRISGFRAKFLHCSHMDAAKPMAWRLSGAYAQGAGTLLDLGSHVLDLILHITGESITHISAQTFTLHTQRRDATGALVPVQSDDSIVMLPTLACGVPGMVEASKIATGVEEELLLEIHGEKGALRLNMLDPDTLYFFDQTRPDGPHGGERGFTAIRTAQRYGAPARYPGERSSGGWLRSHVHCMYSFFDSIATSTPAQSDFAQACALQCVMDAAWRSACSGNRETVVYL